jgi:hypothetical protein
VEYRLKRVLDTQYKTFRFTKEVTRVVVHWPAGPRI